jgi:hypothetical protein
MATEPKCSLCTGQLVREREVAVGHDQAELSLAWVCTQCSAAFPIAVRQSIMRSFDPLYADGKRTA